MPEATWTPGASLMISITFGPPVRLPTRIWAAVFSAGEDLDTGTNLGMRGIVGPATGSPDRIWGGPHRCQSGRGHRFQPVVDWNFWPACRVTGMIRGGLPR